MKRLDELHAGVHEVTLTDFPEYANVGDSAIVLGQLAYWRARSIRVNSIFSEQLIPGSVFRSSQPIAIQGGGNLGGLYPLHSEHRYRLAEELPPETILIQEPQSVHFPAETHRVEFMRRMASRRNMRVGVRDRDSLRELEHHISGLTLAPDPVHVLGEIVARPPEQEFIVLGRTDGEAKGEPALDAVDWLTDHSDMIPFWRLNLYARRLPVARPLLRRDNQFWQSRAERRMQRGIDQLSLGSTVVTNRLHAMLIGLQMGRRVIAIDNATGKLSAYLEAWMPDGHPNLEFHPDQDLRDVALQVHG